MAVSAQMVTVLGSGLGGSLDEFGLGLQVGGNGGGSDSRGAPVRGVGAIFGCYPAASCGLGFTGSSPNAVLYSPFSSKMNLSTSSFSTSP